MTDKTARDILREIRNSGYGGDLSDDHIDLALAELKALVEMRFEKYYFETNKLSDNDLWKFCRSNKPKEIVSELFGEK